MNRGHEEANNHRQEEYQENRSPPHRNEQQFFQYNNGYAIPGQHQPQSPLPYQFFPVFLAQPQYLQHQYRIINDGYVNEQQFNNQRFADLPPLQHFQDEFENADEQQPAPRLNPLGVTDALVPENRPQNLLETGNGEFEQWLRACPKPNETNSHSMLLGLQKLMPAKITSVLRKINHCKNSTRNQVLQSALQHELLVTERKVNNMNVTISRGRNRAMNYQSRYNRR